MCSAVGLLETMRHSGIQPNIVTYTTLLKGFCDIGQIKEAKCLFFEQMGKNRVNFSFPY